MAKLLGIVNPNLDPSDPAYWLWRSNIPWEAEQLSMEKSDCDGNTLIRILGPATPPGSKICEDGVWLKMQFNPATNPTPKYSGELGAPMPAPTMPDMNMLPAGTMPSMSAIDGGSPAPMIAPKTATVATSERLEGETKSQSIRRKAMALRWQAAQLDELAAKMEPMEAQGLI